MLKNLQVEENMIEYIKNNIESLNKKITKI